MSIGWSRSDKIAVIGVAAAIMTCLAALAVIPELRSWVGLEGRSTTSTNANTTNSSSDKSSAANSVSQVPKGQGEGLLPLPPRGRANIKVAGLVLLANTANMQGILRVDQEEEWVIHIQDTATYTNGQSYLKLSVCNMGVTEHRLEELRVWYTPANDDGSINWHFQGEKANKYPLKKALLSLKANECRTLGGWNQEDDHPAPLSSPLGKVHISRNGAYADVSIDLARAEAEGGVRLVRF